MRKCLWAKRNGYYYGSLKKPVILTPAGNSPYKVMEDGHVVIIRNGEKYSITGKKLNDK